MRFLLITIFLIKSSFSISQETVKDPRIVADEIQSGSLEPSDNFITFRLLDSLTNPNKNSRIFYLSAANTVVLKSDGALAEVIGSYLLKYLENYPREFASNLDNEELFEAYSNYIAYELYFAEDYQQELRDLKFSIGDANSKSLDKFLEVVGIKVEEINNGG